MFNSLRIYLVCLRYEKARQDPPLLLYTDQNCCNISGASRCAQLFVEWGHLQVRKFMNYNEKVMWLTCRCALTYGTS